AYATAVATSASAYARTIATGNGKNISQSNLDQFVSLLVSQGEKDTPELREQVKQEMIHRQVAVQAAEKAGLDKNNAVKQEIELARQGILVRALLEDHLKKNPITDAQIQSEYDKIKKSQESRVEYKVSHILVADQAKAEALTKDINSKKLSFEAAAKKDSIDPGSGKNGGDLGWGPATNYVPEFAAAVESLKKGETTAKPVQSQFGWHIIRVEDTRPLEFPALDQVKPQLSEMLRQQSLAQFQENLMKSATIK